METVNIAPQPFTDFSKALEHASGRVRLAVAEYAESQRRSADLNRELAAAADHQNRCQTAAKTAEQRLVKLAATGRVDAYCAAHDVFYAFTPVVKRKADGSVDHYTDTSKAWDGVPPCPECARGSTDIGFRDAPQRISSEA